MMRFPFWLITVSAFFVFSSGAHGQIASTARHGAGVYAGGTIPLAQLADSAKAGYHVGGTVDRALNSVLDLIAGVGIYRLRFDFVCRGVACTGPEREGKSATNMGFNTGAGATVLVRGFRPSFQIAYHAIAPKAGEHGHDALILVSFGLMLR